MIFFKLQSVVQISFSTLCAFCEIFNCGFKDPCENIRSFRVQTYTKILIFPSVVSEKLIELYERIIREKDAQIADLERKLREK